MNKLVAFILGLCIIFNISASIFAQSEIDGLEENLTAIYADKNFTQSQLDTMYNAWLESFNNSWDAWLVKTKALGKMKTDSDEAEYEYWVNFQEPDFSKGLRISIISRKYLAQYASEKKLKYLFEKDYWSVATKENGCIDGRFDENGRLILNLGSELNTDLEVISDEMLLFLQDDDSIAKLLTDKGETQVNDIKVFSPWHGITLLYIRCLENEYIIKLYASTGTGKEHIPQIVAYKLYTADEVMQALINKTDEAYTYRQNLIELAELYKPTYNTEAEALQEAGLLNGNENGLDLLKPLTRAEAVTLLVRALGLESETVNYTTSEFSDIANDNWAAPYAALAKSRGIANGISDTEFAPDERVTSDQFAAFALRAIGESDFDYTEGTEILIDKGIITEEQAETMDLFTRGDMAKIIYEMREMGLMQ